MNRTGELTPKEWEQLKKDRELVNLYLKQGGRYIAGPFEGFNYAQRRRLQRMERRERRRVHRSLSEAERARRLQQRHEAIDKARREMRGEKDSTRKPGGIVRRGLNAVREIVGQIFGRGRQKK